MIKQITQILFKVFNTLFIALSFALIFIAIFKKEWFEMFIEWLKVVIEWLGYWNYFIVFLSALIEAFPVIWIVLPGQNILLIVGGFFWDISYTNLIYVVIIASLWAILWNYIWYLLGIKYWDNFFEKYGIWFGIGQTEVKYLKKGIEKWGALGITFGKFHPMTRSFLPFIAGSMGMKSQKFMLSNALWSFIWASSMVIFWVIFVKYYKIFLEYAGTISTVLLIIIGLYIYFYKKKEFLQYWKEKNEEIEKMALEKANK